MNVSEFPTNSKWKKKKEAVSTESLGNAHSPVNNSSPKFTRLNTWMFVAVVSLMCWVRFCFGFVYFNMCRVDLLPPPLSIFVSSIKVREVDFRFITSRSAVSCACSGEMEFRASKFWLPLKLETISRHPHPLPLFIFVLLLAFSQTSKIKQWEIKLPSWNKRPKKRWNIQN